MADLEGKIVSQITLNVDTTDNNPAYIYAVQSDSMTRYIRVTLMSQAGQYNPTNFVQLNALRPDGVSVYTSGTVDVDGTILFPLTQQTLASYGKVYCDVSVFDTEDGQDLILTSSPFYFIVGETYTNFDILEESLAGLTSPITLFLEAVSALDEKVDNNEVTANPQISGSETDLTGIQIGDTKYKIPDVIALPRVDGDYIVEISSGLASYKDTSDYVKNSNIASATDGDPIVSDGAGGIKVGTNILGKNGTITLLSANWVDSVYTLTLNDLGSNDAVFFSPQTATDKTNLEKANIIITTNGTSVTFSAQSAPSADIALNYFIARGGV